MLEKINDGYKFNTSNGEYTVVIVGRKDERLKRNDGIFYISNVDKQNRLLFISNIVCGIDKIDVIKSFMKYKHYE